MAPQQAPDDGSSHDVSRSAIPDTEVWGAGVSDGDPASTGTPSASVTDGQDATSGGSPQSASAGHPFLLYTVARILVFLAAAGILYLFGARGFLLLLLAVIVSGLISFILLDRLRNQVSERVAARMDASRERRERAAAAEDDIF